MVGIKTTAMDSGLVVMGLCIMDFGSLVLRDIHFILILIYWFSLTNDDASNGSQLALLPNDMNWILWWAFCVVGL